MRPIGGVRQPLVSPSSSRPAVMVAIPGRVSPGHTAFTRMPDGPASIASICASVMSAAFDTEYAPISSSPHTPASDETCTIEPPPASRSADRARSE